MLPSSHSAVTLRRWFPREIVILLAIVTLIYTIFLPESFFEFDETLFARAVVDYQPWEHHPPPPGYPLFIAIAQSLNRLLDDPFVTLVSLSYLSALIGLVLLAHAFAGITGSLRAGTLGASLFYLSPVMLIHGTLPISEPLALAFLALTLLLLARAVGRPGVVKALLFGLAAGLTIGCRPQFSIFIVPMMLASVFVLRGWRVRASALSGFVLGCLVWFVPFVAVLGGFDRFIEFELGQAAYFASHDANISRSGWTFPRIVARFVVRPWGQLWLAMLVMLLAAVGAFQLLRDRFRFTFPAVMATSVYLIFAVATMDPADGARYAIPVASCAALLAGAGISRITEGWRAPVIAGVIAAAGLAYIAPFLFERSSSESPPAQAAAWIRENVPNDAVILYELPLWPHATFWLADYRIMKIDEGAPLLVRRPELPVYIYGNGGSYDKGARMFWWNGEHAFTKLTRKHYGVVSVVEVPPQDRYQIVSGVYDSERGTDHEWRWVAPRAELILPDVDANRVAVRMSLSRTAPKDTTRVRVSVNDQTAGTFVVSKSQQSVAVLPISDGEQRIRFDCDESFVPADLSGGKGDSRRLCFQLIGVEQQGMSGSEGAVPLSRRERGQG